MFTADAFRQRRGGRFEDFNAVGHVFKNRLEVGFGFTGRGGNHHDDVIAVDDQGHEDTEGGAVIGGPFDVHGCPVVAIDGSGCWPIRHFHLLNRIHLARYLFQLGYRIVARKIGRGPGNHQGNTALFTRIR